jgi:hypothetical protein
MLKSLKLIALIGLVLSFASTSWAQTTSPDTGSSSGHKHHHKDSSSDSSQSDNK